MSVHANVPFKNEAILLKHLVPIWNQYPVDEWVFFNDRSTDDSVAIIKTLDAKVTVLENTNCIVGGEWHETKCRQAMLQYSRDNGAEYIFALDADEFLSSSMIEEWDQILSISRNMEIHAYWYNFVDDVHHIRQDSAYLNKYMNFIMYIPEYLNFTGNRMKHIPRVPRSTLYGIKIKKYGLMHLQCMNVEFYALKQLWYKHWEYHVEKKDANTINNMYDRVVNNLNFNKIKIDDSLVKGIEIDQSIFKELLEVKGYKEYVLNNLVPELVTFGREFLEN